MIEIRRESHDQLLPVGSIWWKAERVVPKFALYDIYERDETGEYVELWVPVKEYKEENG